MMMKDKVFIAFYYHKRCAVSRWIPYGFVLNLYDSVTVFVI